MLNAPVGWRAEVPPNGFANRPRTAGPSNTNALGLGTPEPDVEIETTPEHRNLVAGDPTCSDWTRSYDDPNVVALRQRLRNHNGMPALEIVTPDQIERATELFYRDGFVVVRDALVAGPLADLKAATDRVVQEILDVDPDGSAGGGAGGLPHRYSFGSTSATRHRLHDPAWTNVIDLPTTSPILTSIFGSADYLLGGGGGDVALPGAIEYQGLHSDNIWIEPHDPVSQLTMRDLPLPVVTINFTMIDLTPENGPMRVIPGSQRSKEPIPTLAEEPQWMKYSTMCPVPAGAAVFRDNRLWHGGTPNLSRDVRAYPNLEFFAPWFRSSIITRSMPHERWLELSPHGRRITRYVACGPDETVPGLGFTHPRAKERERIVAQELASMDSAQAAQWSQRL